MLLLCIEIAGFWILLHLYVTCKIKENIDDEENENNINYVNHENYKNNEEDNLKQYIIIKIPDKKFINNTDLCTICMDPLQKNNEQLVEIKCYHIFHRKCLRKLIDNCDTYDIKCPNCRYVLTELE